MNRLAAGDARFVEVYHSNGGKIGMMEHVVDSDKYISNGLSLSIQEELNFHSKSDFSR